VVLNDPLGFIGYGAYDGTTAITSVNTVQLIATATENWSPTNRGTEWKIRTTLTGTTTARDDIVVRGDGAVAMFNDISSMYSVFFNNSFDVVRTSNDALAGAFSLVKYRSPSLAAVQNGDSLGVVQWSGSNPSLYVSAVIETTTTENWTGTGSGTQMRFRVTPTGTVAQATILTLTGTAAEFGRPVAIGVGGQTFATLIAGSSTALSGSTTQRVVQASAQFGSGATSFAQGFRAVPTFASASYTTTNFAHFYAGTVAAGGGGHVITNAHGLYVESVAAGTNNYAIYTNDGQVRFGDNMDLTNHEALNFRIENRTSDPGSPTVGQIWLRTDL
jgi:hypothetical protein